MSANAPRVESFIIRFIQNRSNPRLPTESSDWRGVVVHVQTSESRSFADFADAVAFISRYVPIGDFIFNYRQELHDLKSLREEEAK